MIWQLPTQHHCLCEKKMISDLRETIKLVGKEFSDECYLLAAPNGPVPSSGPRASPAHGNAVPNGKPTSPYPERQQSPIASSQQIAQQTVSSKDPRVAAQAASDMKNVVRRKLTGYVGFANLPNQWHRKSVRKGFNFNVMVVGKFNGFHSSVQNSSYQANPAWASPRS